MKLISIHINNYGKLSDFDFNFTDGVNSLCEDNGYGKSTVVSFLKAMFYGLSSYKKNSVEFVDRMHFYPFAKGDFGGNVTFEFSGRTYRIERSFGEKSDKSDTLKVYCDSTATDELGDVPGLTLFGINADSFERLLCINAEKIKIASTGDMNKKIGSYALNTADDFDIDDIMEKLKNQDKTYKTSIDKKKENIKKLNSEIHNLELEKNALDSKYALLNEAQSKADTSKRIHSEASAKAALIEMWKNYDEKLAECETLSKQKKALEARYIKGVPDKQKACDIRQICNKQKADIQTLKMSEIDDTVVQEYEKLSRAYPKGFADDEQTAEADELIAELENARRDYKALASAPNNNDEQSLEYHFGGKAPSDDFIAQLESDKLRCDELARSLQSINKTEYEYNSVTVTEKKSNKKLCAVLAVIAAAVLLSGVAFVFSSAVVGVLLIVLGALLLLTDAFVYLNFKIETQHVVENEPVEKPNPEYEKTKNELDRVSSKMLTDLAYYRYSGKDPSELLFELKNDTRKYKDIISQKAETEKELLQIQTKGEDIKSQLDRFFSAYGVENSDYRAALDKMKTDKVRFESLHKQITGSKNKCEQLEKDIFASQQSVQDFITHYALTEPFDADNVIKDIEELERLDTQLSQREKDAQKYKSENSLDKRPKTAGSDITVLEQQMQQSIRELEKITSDVDDLEQRVSVLDDKKAELKELTEQKDELTKKKELLLLVKKEISESELSLKRKHVKPILDKFRNYALLIEDAIGHKVEMDKDYSVKYDIMGELRSYLHLSSGNLSICALCFRLAMIDSMFETEHPFIIMDDPFVYLDSEHFNKTKELIQKLGKDKQIVYFCCHESRSLK